MKALKSTIIYLASNIIEKGMAFLLIPMYTHYLSTKDYGMLNILQAIIGIMIVFFALSLNGAASRFHFDGGALYRKFHYGNIFSMVTLISMLMAILFIIFGKHIFLLFGNIPMYPYIYLVLVIVYGSIIFMIYQLYLQMHHRAIEYGVNNILRFLFSTAVAIYMVVISGKKADGVLIGSAASLFVFFVYFVVPSLVFLSSTRLD